MALSESGYVFVWGENEFANFSTPKETHFKSFNDVYAIFSKIKSSFGSILIGEELSHITIANNIINLSNDPKYSDIKFKIEDKRIYSHKVILQSRCEHFRPMLSENWSINSSKKNRNNSIFIFCLLLIS